MLGALGTAIDGLYEAFAAYPRPATFEGCECCWKGTPIGPGRWGPRHAVAVVAPGGARPLRTLSAQDLGDVPAQLPHLGGTLEVYRHYLPRVREALEECYLRWL